MALSHEVFSAYIFPPLFLVTLLLIIESEPLAWFTLVWGVGVVQKYYMIQFVCILPFTGILLQFERKEGWKDGGWKDGKTRFPTPYRYFQITFLMVDNYSKPGGLISTTIKGLPHGILYIINGSGIILL